MSPFSSSKAHVEDSQSLAIERGTHTLLPLPLRMLIGLGSVAVFLVILVLAREAILLAVGDYLVVSEDNLQSADIIHVLGGDLERIDYGVQLYQQDYAPRLFVSGCDCLEYKERALAGGVRPDDLLSSLSWATTTYEEALALQEFLDRDEDAQSVIIVSSPYHMRRAQWTFDRRLGDSTSIQFASVPFEMSSHKERWWTERRSRKLVASEYLKFVYYNVKYGFGLFLGNRSLEREN